MSVTTGQNIKDLGDALFGAVSSTEKTRVEASLTRRFFTIPLTIAADTALAEQAVFTVPTNLVNGIRIKAIHIVMKTAQTAASDTNFRLFTVKKYTAAGASGATIGTWTTALTGGTALAALTPAALTLTAANTVVASGAPITITVSDDGTSVACDGSMTVDYEEL